MRRTIPEPFVQVGAIWLPPDLAAQVTALLLDPTTKRIRYGEMRKLTIKLFSNWVDEQIDHTAAATNAAQLKEL